MSLPPGPEAPTLVQTWRWLRRPTELLESCAARFGETFRLSIIGFGEIVVLAEPQALRNLFAAGPQAICQPRNARFLAALGPSSLLLLNGEEHARHRRLLQPALHARYSPAFAATLQRLRETTVETWPLEQPVALLPLLQDLTRRVMIRVLLGDGDEAASATLQGLCARAIPLVEAPGMVLPLSLQPLLGRHSPWQRALAILREGDALLHRLIAERRRASDLDQREDLLSQLVRARDETGRQFSDRELRDELFTLLITSHDTTAISVCWTIHELLATPPILHALAREIRALRHDGVLDLAALDRAPLLDAVLRESQRLWPVFPILSRQLRVPMRLAGFDLPAGTRVAPCPYLSQRSPRVFSEPHRFLPQREKPPAFSYYPFGGGHRRCAGADLAIFEMKRLLGTLLDRLVVASAELSPVQPGWRFFSLSPRGGLKVRLTRPPSGVKAPGCDRILDETPSFLPILRAL